MGMQVGSIEIGMNFYWLTISETVSVTHRLDYLLIQLHIYRLDLYAYIIV